MQWLVNFKTYHYPSLPLLDNSTTKDVLIADQVESQNDKTTRSDSRHERADQAVDGQLDPLTAIGLREQPAEEGKKAKDDNTMRNPMMASEFLHPGQDGGNFFFRDHQQAIGHTGNGQRESE